MRYFGFALIFGFIVLCLVNRTFAQQIVVGFLGGRRAIYERGTYHMQRGEYREARSVLETALSADPSDPDLHELLGDVCVKLLDCRRAIEEYSEVLRLSPRRYSTYTKRGAVYLLRKEWRHAVADFSEGIRIRPDEPGCYHNRAVAYQELGYYSKVRADLESAYQRGGGIPTAYSLAILLAGCPDAAVRDGHRAIEYAQETCKWVAYNEDHSLSILAAAHAEAGQWEEAIRRSKQALELATGANRPLERMYLELYQSHEPYRQFTLELVSKKHPLTAGEALFYAIIKKSAGDRVGAIADLRKAIEMNPRLCAAHCELGALINSENITEAIDHFNRCLEMNPKYVEALTWRAISYLWLGKNREALKDSKAALVLDANDFSARTVNLWAAASCGAADRVLQEVNALSGDQAQGVWRHALRGHCDLLLGRFVEAIDELTEGLRQNPSDALARANLAVALSALGKEEEAKRELENCVRHAPSLRSPTLERMKNTKEKQPTKGTGDEKDWKAGCDS
jgi:tetratricopeptide (TPR) repeat protein